MDESIYVSNPELLGSIIDTVGDGIYCVDTERRIFFWNKAAERITGYPAEEMIGKQCFDTNLDHIDTKGRPLCDLLCPLVGTIFDGRMRQENVTLKHRDGHRIAVVVNTFPIEKDGTVIGAMEIFRDCLPPIMDGDLVQSLAEAMMHDELTGLPNKTYLHNYLAYKLRENKHFLHSFILAAAEIEDYRELERSLGTAGCGRVMKLIAENLRHCARKHDLIGRWSDGEFFGIFSGASEEDGRIVGEKFRRWIEDVNTQLPEGTGITVSVGITAVRAEDTLDTLIDRADKYMYRAETGTEKVVWDKI